MVEGCAARVDGLQVQNTRNDAWKGTIEISYDNGVTYTAATCVTCNEDTAGSRSTSSIVVDGNSDSNGQSPTRCQNGRWCSIAVPVAPARPASCPQTCYRAITGTESNNDGRLKMEVDSGSGTFHEVSDGEYERGSTVVEVCFPRVASLQIGNTHNDAWKGSIEVSYDDGTTYAPATCTTCNGDTFGSRGATSIVVDGNSDGSSLGEVTCLNGALCSIAG